MKKTLFTEYGIGERVFHATIEGDEGIVVNISYDFRSDCVKYEVVFGRLEGDCVWCYGEELSKSRIY